MKPGVADELLDALLAERLRLRATIREQFCPVCRDRMRQDLKRLDAQVRTARAELRRQKAA